MTDENKIIFDRILVIYIYTAFLLTNRHTFFKIIYSGLLLYNSYIIFKNRANIKLKSIILCTFLYFISYFLIMDPNPFYYLVTFYLPMPNFFRGIFIIIFITYFVNNHIFKENDDNKNKENKKDVSEKENKEGNKEEKKEEKIEEKKEEKNKEKNKEKEDSKPEEKKEEEKNDKEKEIKENGQPIEKEIKNENIKEPKYFLSNDIRYYLLDDKMNILYFLVFLILIRISIYFYDIKLWIEFSNKEKLLSFNKNSNKTNSNTIYYISSIVFNIEPIIKDWIGEMKKLINYLGPENVIVSIYENGDSTDKTRKYLKFFENYLINKKVLNLINTEKIEEKEGVDRIRFLARLRNRALDLLYNIDIDFSNTKIIFFNDIIFRFEDIVKLIATNNGNYDSVCGMDYYESFYDTWASIGLDGKQFRRYFPYMYNKEQQDAYINGETIRTFSCWNGVTVINAKAFEDRNRLFFRTGTKKRQSECTLLHADMYFMGYRKVFVNTQVAVSYTYDYYYKNHYLYPWTKNLLTYFYYYFKYGFIKRNYNLTNLVDSKIDFDNGIEKEVIEFMIKK